MFLSSRLNTNVRSLYNFSCNVFKLNLKNTTNGINNEKPLKLKSLIPFEDFKDYSPNSPSNILLLILFINVQIMSVVLFDCLSFNMFLFSLLCL